MKHDTIRHMLSEYLDGAVTGKEKAEIEEHLTSCTKCSDALAELQKTIQHVKEIEEVNPPAWMTQKIMARVREEAEQKKSIFRRLFYPLHVKLPIEAVAVAFLTVTAFYIYQTIQPQMKMAEAPMEGFAAKQETPSPVAPEKETPSPVIARNEKGDSSLRSEQAPQSPPLADKFASPAAAPAPSDERIMKEQESVATARKREEAKPFAGLMTQDEAPREAPAPATKAKAFAFAEKKEAGIHVTVKVKDVETANKEIEKAVTQLMGKVIKAESLESRKVITVELSPDKTNALFEKLKLIGEVEEKTLTPTGYAGNVEVRITILKN
jgi:anti-sigma factor RsiW